MSDFSSSESLHVETAGWRPINQDELSEARLRWAEAFNRCDVDGASAKLRASVENMKLGSTNVLEAALEIDRLVNLKVREWTEQQKQMTEINQALTQELEKTKREAADDHQALVAKIERYLYEWRMERTNMAEINQALTQELEKTKWEGVANCDKPQLVESSLALTQELEKTKWEVVGFRQAFAAETQQYFRKWWEERAELVESNQALAQELEKAKTTIEYIRRVYPVPVNVQTQ